MHRILHDTADANLNGFGKAGFTGGNPATGIPSTRLTPEWCNALQEEIANAVELSGLSLNDGDNTQLAQAIGQRIAQAAFRIAALPDHDGAVANSSEIAIAVDGEHRRATIAELFAGQVTNAWTPDNDGAGSGLDADLLDGLQATSFARTTSGAHVEAFAMYDGDLNSLDNHPGVVVSECTISCTNLPPEINNNCLLIQMADGGGNDIRLQLVMSWSGEGFFQRIKWGGGLPGAWSTWKSIGADSTDAISDLRDQIALTNLRTMVNTAITTGALVGGYQLELTPGQAETSTLLSTSSPGISVVSASPSYIRNSAPASLGSGAWSVAGATQFSPQSALSDGSISAEAVYSASAGAQVLAGADFGSAKTVTGFRIRCSTGNGFCSNNGTVTLTLYGSNDPSFSSKTHLQTYSFADPLSATPEEKDRSYSVSNPQGPFRYAGLYFSHAAAVTYYLAEVDWTVEQAVDSIVALPPLATPTPPPSAVVYCLLQGDVTLDTDFDVQLSRNGGGSWMTAPATVLTPGLTVNGTTWTPLRCRGSLTSLPSGTDVRARIVLRNSKPVRIAAPSLYVE
jgi:hypothetical protein